MKKKTTYVIDTNVFLTDYEALDKFGSNDIVIPIKVLEEIDKNKKRQDGVGLNARHFIRVLDELREKNTDKTNLKNGIKLGPNKGMIRVRSSEADVELLKGHLDPTHPDNIILAAALAEMENNENVVLVSLDVNMRVKCDSLGVKSETYQENQVVKKAKDIFTGFSRHLVEDDIIDSVYNGEELLIEKCEQSKNYKANQFLILTSKFSEKKTCLVMFDGFDKPVVRLKEYVKNKEGKVFGLYAKNKEQQMALNLLMDPKIPVVTLMGSAGSGKTLISIAAALKMTLEENAYSKIIVSRPIMPMGKDIGFLPGPQPLDADILTPNGWVKMGDIKIGDFVIGGNGLPVKVVKIMPKGKKKVVKFITIDDLEVESCEDHLWSTKTFEEKKRGKDFSIKTTKQIIETFLTKKGKINHYLPRITQPVQYEQKEALPIPPYTLGVLLGDGCLGDSISFTSMDQEIIDRVSEEVKTIDCVVKKYMKDRISYTISSQEQFYNNKTAREVVLTNLSTNEETSFSSIGKAVLSLGKGKNHLERLCNKELIEDNFRFSFREVKRYQNPIKEKIYNLSIHTKRAWEKNIPHSYLFASVEDRISLLRGLMDTDGTIKKNGEASYTTTSLQLAEDISSLVRSLGGKARICSRNRINKTSVIDGRIATSRRISYEFNISLPKEINPFFVQRKASRHDCKYIHYNGIKSFEYLGEKEVQCIQVDNQDGLYVTNNFIVTHNSVDEKLKPWIAPIDDNLEFLFGLKDNKADSKTTGDPLEKYKEKGIIQVEALTYIRGRSLSNAFIIIDEAQNLTSHEIKTILTRVGENTKIVLTGDVEQIDNIYINESTNGLTYAIEKLKDSELTGHVTLQKGERSKVATLCAQVL